MNTPFDLYRDPLGRLVATDAQGHRHVGVVPVRAFPIAAPDEGLSLIDADGHEVAWVSRMSELHGDARSLVEAELALREFMPRIERISAVSSFATPSTWSVHTDRGQAELVLKGEEDIRRLSASTLLIADRHGVNYLIQDLQALDRHTRKLLDRFL